MRDRYRGAVVAVGGPPHSGKSVFVSELYGRLLVKDPSGTFLQRTAPDGEGMWSYEADPAVAQKLRRKGRYDPEFVAFIMQSVTNLSRTKPRVLLDLGGLMAPPNEELLRLSTHLIVVSRSEEEAEAWRQYGEAEGCVTLAVITSRLFRTETGMLDRSRRTPDQPWAGDPPIRGELWQLDGSGPRDLYEDAVEKFADVLWRRLS